MKYNVFGYLLGEGFRNVFKNKKYTFASLMIMWATMIIFGIFLVLEENINNFVADIESAQGIQVFIKQDTDQSQIDELGEKIRKVDGVNTIEFVSKEQALNQMRESLGDKEDLLAGYEEKNVFPPSYLVTLTDLSKSKEVQEQIKTFENVKDITSKDTVVTTLMSLANGIKIGTGIILALLVIISIFIISYTIKITVHARRKEISIMKYVGATNSFIRWPFIVEGVIIGIAASIISIVVIGIAYNLIANAMVKSVTLQMINMRLVPFGEMLNSIIFVYMLLGIGIGALGSIISMRKYLKV